VTGGHDRLVNLFAIGNDKSIQVSGVAKDPANTMDEFEKKRKRRSGLFNERAWEVCCCATNLHKIAHWTSFLDWTSLMKKMMMIILLL
jgi:hypothetical protein